MKTMFKNLEEVMESNTVEHYLSVYKGQDEIISSQNHANGFDLQYHDVKVEGYHLYADELRKLEGVQNVLWVVENYEKPNQARKFVAIYTFAGEVYTQQFRELGKGHDSFLNVGSFSVKRDGTFRRAFGAITENVKERMKAQIKHFYSDHPSLRLRLLLGEELEFIE
jgi:hypothetical protein